jgi:hypothetical protein
LHRDRDAVGDFVACDECGDQILAAHALSLGHRQCGGNHRSARMNLAGDGRILKIEHLREDTIRKRAHRRRRLAPISDDRSVAFRRHVVQELLQVLVAVRLMQSDTAKHHAHSVQQQHSRLKADSRRQIFVPKTC